MMKAPLSGLVAKGYKPHQHKWQLTERKIPGAILRFHGCTGCKSLKAYDLRITDSNALRGQWELAERSRHY